MTSKRDVMELIRNSNTDDWYTIDEMFGDNFGINYIFSPNIRLRIELQYHLDIDIDYKKPGVDFHDILQSTDENILLGGEIKYDGNIVEILNLVKDDNMIYIIPSEDDEGVEYITETELKLSKIFTYAFSNNFSKEKLTEKRIYVK